MDAEALASLRPAQRDEAILASLAASRQRLVSDPRPGTLSCFVSTTQDGVAVVAPLEPADAEVDRPRRLAVAVAAALAQAAALPPPVDGGDAQLEGAVGTGSSPSGSLSETATWSPSSSPSS